MQLEQGIQKLTPTSEGLFHLWHSSASVSSRIARRILRAVVVRPRVDLPISSLEISWGDWSFDEYADWRHRRWAIGTMPDYPLQVSFQKTRTREGRRPPQLARPPLALATRGCTNATFGGAVVTRSSSVETPITFHSLVQGALLCRNGESDAVWIPSRVHLEQVQNAWP